MRIQSIKIVGFKSFRQEASVDGFGPGLHIVIGENGSGKSNLLAAIDMVFQPNPRALPLKEQKALVSSGWSSAQYDRPFVELVLDNSDNLFLDHGEQVILKRTLVGRKGEPGKLYINGRAADEDRFRLDLQGLYNSLYYLKQGQLIDVIMMSDSRRWNMIKGIITYNQWEAYKEKTVATLQSCAVELKELEECVGKLEEELEIQRGEAQEFINFQEREKKINALSYLISKRDYKKLKEKYDSLKNEELVREMGKLKQEILSSEMELEELRLSLEYGAEMTKDIEMSKTNLRGECDKIETTLQSLFNELQELKKQRTHLENLSASGLNTNTEDELKQLQEQLELKSEDFNFKLAKEMDINKDVAKIHAEIHVLKEKICRGDSGSDPAYQTRKQTEYNELKSELQKIRVTLESHSIQTQNLEEKHRGTTEKLVRTTEELQVLGESLERDKVEMRKQVAKRDELLSLRWMNWDERASKQRKVADLKERLAQADVQFRSCGKKSFFEAHAHVKDIIEKLRISVHPEDQLTAKNYFGILIENIIGVPEEYWTATEVAGGAKLFFHVVKNRSTGLRIMKEFNKGRCRGEILLLVEDDLVERDRIPTELIKTNRTERLLDKIEFRECAQKSVMYTFGNYILCRDFGDVKREKRHKVKYVTLDGDVVTGDGVMTGGYRDHSSSVFRIQAERLGFLSKLHEFNKELKNISDREYGFHQEVATINDAINKWNLNIDTKQNQIQEKTAEKKGLMLELNAIETKQKESVLVIRELSKKEETINQNLMARLKDITENFPPAAPNSAQLLRARKDELNELLKEYELQVELVENVRQEHAQQELQRKILAYRHDEMDLAMLEDGNLGMINSRITQLQKDIDKTRTMKEALVSNLTQLQKREEKTKRKVGDIQALLNTVNSNLFKMSARLEEGTGILDRNSIKSVGLKAQMKEKLEKVIAFENSNENYDLAENYGDYINMPTKELCEVFEKLSEEHLASTPTNLKAATIVDELGGKISQSKVDLDYARQDMAKAEILLHSVILHGPKMAMRYMKRLQASFREIYRELQSDSGCREFSEAADLVLYGEGFEFGYEDTAAGPDGTYWSTANFIGAKMEIIASNGLRHDIRTLSGGEKCILAMSFILAVQRNSLGKVFLFDELDQHLDQKHGEAIAHYMKKYANENNMQFFCTSFCRGFVEQADSVVQVSHANHASRVAKLDVSDALNLSFLSSSTSSSSFLSGSSLIDATASSASSATISMPEQSI